MTKLVVVSAVAMVDQGGRVLLAERPQGKQMAGLWEFPGGKVNADESPEGALIREIKEELGVTLDRGALLPLTFASHDYGSFHLLMPFYMCPEWEGTVNAREGQALRWLKPEEMNPAEMPPADLPLVEFLKAFI